MTLSCTKKVLDLLKKHHSIETEKSTPSFHNWYVDVIMLERKKHFLFTHAESLFSFFIYAGTKQQHSNIQALFTEKLKELIVREVGTAEDYLKEAIPENAVFRFEKTNSRSVLGTMNEYKKQIYCHIEYEGDLEKKHDLIHHYMNKYIVKKEGEYIRPRELFKEQLEEHLKN